MMETRVLSPPQNWMLRQGTNAAPSSAWDPHAATFVGCKKKSDCKIQIWPQIGQTKKPFMIAMWSFAMFRVPPHLLLQWHSCVSAKGHQRQFCSPQSPFGLHYQIKWRYQRGRHRKSSSAYLGLNMLQLFLFLTFVAPFHLRSHEPSAEGVMKVSDGKRNWEIEWWQIVKRYHMLMLFDTTSSCLTPRQNGV